MPHKPAIHRPHPRMSKAENRPSAALRGYDATWRKIRLAALREAPLCVECLKAGRTEPATEVDHITPLARGGTHARSNLQPLCKMHHSQKTAREDMGR
ncbi:MAG: HNH endonuclease [Planctomycetaceae bacterium]|nr:HNH endonuclease [Planctomycetaceae bacterium]